LRPAAESGRIVPRRMRRPRLKLVSVPNLVAVTVLGAEGALLLLRRRRVPRLALSPVADYARPGWRMPGAERQR